VSSQKGLPQDRRMRHDTHFVEELTSYRHGSFGQMVNIDRIEPNPHQPRKQFGDLSDMVASIKEKGILEPILVRRHDDRYQIIAGERRYQASLLAGLSQIPCVEIDVDNRGCLEISLIENLQRKDLTPFEEAAALQKLCDQFGYTHEQVARKLGKSRTSITEILSLNRMPEEVQDLCRQADITSRSTLLEIVRQRTIDDMRSLIAKIGSHKLKREEVRDLKREAGHRRTAKGRNFVYRYQAPERQFSFNLRFSKPEVDRQEMIRALREILQKLLSEEESPSPVSRGSSRGVGTPQHGSRAESPN
jgi:ParB family transcriptional regulator, chromosome partitioning protein